MKQALVLIVAGIAVLGMLGMGVSAHAAQQPVKDKFKACTAEHGLEACKERFSRTDAKLDRCQNLDTDKCQRMAAHKVAMKERWANCVAEHGEAACKERMQAHKREQRETHRACVADHGHDACKRQASRD